jgi:hypothetical protein
MYWALDAYALSAGSRYMAAYVRQLMCRATYKLGRLW